MSENEDTVRPCRRAADRFEGPDLIHSLLEASGEVMILLDPDFTVRYNSPSLETVFNMDRNASVGLCAADIPHPDDRASVRAALEACRDNKRDQLLDHFRLRNAEGDWQWAEARILWRGDDPAIQGLLVILRDVSDRELLKQHVTIAENARGIGTYRWGITSDRIDVSDTTLSLLGLSKRSATPNTERLLEIVHPDDVEELLAVRATVVEAPGPFTTSIRLLCEDGGYRHFVTHGEATTDEEGRITNIVGVIDDISDLLETRQALARTEENYRFMIENAQDIHTRHDLDGTITYASPSTFREFGYAPEDLVGQRLVDIVHPEDKPAIEAAIARVGYELDSITIDYRFQHKDGHYIWFESTVQLVRDKDTNVPIEAVSITRDISERKKNEQEIMEAQKRAEMANRTKSKFLANMSHELRTPLNAIIGFSDMLKLEMFGPIGHDNYRDYVRYINDSGSLLLELISDILDMSKIEAGKLELSLQKVNISETVSACLDLVRPKALEKNQTLHFPSLDGFESVHVTADVRALKQVLLNLLSNAVKFTPANCSITVSIELQGSNVCICVSDEGVGIPESQIPRVLQPFEQVGGDSAVAEEGSGLGLALAKSLTELQGGRFELTSEVDVGTTVRVTFPRKSLPVEMAS